MAAAVSGIERTRDHGEVAVRQLDHLGRRLEPDRAALREQRVVVAAVQVLPARRELMEVARTLLGGEDQAAVRHEARCEFLVRQKCELADLLLRIRFVDVEVRVRLERSGGA